MPEFVFSLKPRLSEKQKQTCLVVPLFQNQASLPTVQRLSLIQDAQLERQLKSIPFQGQLGKTWFIPDFQPELQQSLLLVGAGLPEKCQAKTYLEVLKTAFQKIKELSLLQVSCFLAELPVEDKDIRWKMRQVPLIAEEVFYSFKQFKSAPEPSIGPFKWVFDVLHRRDVRLAEQGLKEGQAIAEGMNFSKNLINSPPNICTPSYLAKQAQHLGKKHAKLSVEILDEKAIKALKMGAFLAVAQGSKAPPQFITLSYQGAKKQQKPIVFVGKGVTFDTGGVCLKPSGSVVGMKYDMSGGASVMGILQSVAALDLPLNVIGLIPATENMLGGGAYRPDDIIESMSGKTIEVLNTDAEGRLILCDALTYAARFNPAYVIDLATLTGACVVALGKQASGLFSNDTHLAEALLSAGEFAMDRLWQLPIWEEYQDQLSSQFADMVNVGGSEAGAITAACFLARFAENYRWAHLDIAGTAAKGAGKDKLATGRPIPALMQFLFQLLEQ